MRTLVIAIAMSCVVTGVFAENVSALPRCSVRTAGAGGPAIVVDGTPLTPMMFVGNNQFGRDDTLVREIGLAASAGLKFFGFYVPLDPSADAASVVDKFCAAYPEGYFIVRIGLAANAERAQAHPDECIATFDTADPPPGTSPKITHLASPASQVWRSETAEKLAQRVRGIAEGPHGHRFAGVVLEYLQTGEWFYPNTEAFGDYSPANLTAFHAWLRRVYKNDKGFRKAWGRGDISIDTAPLPSPLERDAGASGPFRDPLRQRAVIDMHRFQSELLVETIAYFARIVKAATKDRSLVGAYYGYTMELNNNGPRALVHSGHLALGKLLQCDDVDIVFAPYPYFERALGQPGHLHSPVDSIALHGKLFVMEEDTYTHLAQPPSPNLIAPGWNERTQSLEETIAIVQRNLGIALTHGGGLSFFDLLSDGRWSDPDFWRAVKPLYRIAAERRGRPSFAPEVVFAAGEESPLFLRSDTYPVLLHSLSWWRSELDRLGTPVGYYLQSDLPLLPDSVKVLILPDPYVIRRDEQRAIDKFLDRGGTVIWTYAPGVVDEKGLDLGRIAAITGISAQAASDDVPMTIASALSDETVTIDNTSWNPRFVITGNGVDVVARYAQTQEICAAARPAGRSERGVSVYTATPRLPIGCLREICRRAGVHFYGPLGGMTGVFGEYLVAHTGPAGPYIFSWPGTWYGVQRLAPDGPAPVIVEGEPAWTDTLSEKTTAIYRVIDRPDRLPEAKDHAKWLNDEF